MGLIQEIFGAKDTPENPAQNIINTIVLSLPAEIKDPVLKRLPNAKMTYNVLESLFKSATSSIKIFSPFVDPTFTNLSQIAKCPIRAITTSIESRYQKGNAVLERCALHNNLLVKYMIQKQGKNQMFQIHAKMILCDNKLAYVGSANLTDTSIHYNFELGLFVTDKPTIESLTKLFDYLFENVAVPRNLL